MLLKNIKSLLDETVQDFFELTGMDWEGGVVMTVCMGCMFVFFLKRAVYETMMSCHSLLLPVAHIGVMVWLIFFLPATILLLTAFVAAQTQKRYQRQKKLGQSSFPDILAINKQ
jgi:hypothetical protein